MPAPMDLLLAGVPFERPSVLWRRPSVRVTEKCCAPWVKARQEQLQQDVRVVDGWVPMPLAKPRVHQSARNNLAHQLIDYKEDIVAERVGFEPTCPLLAGKTLSRRPRYDRFGTSPRRGKSRNWKFETRKSKHEIRNPNTLIQNLKSKMQEWPS